MNFEDYFYDMIERWRRDYCVGSPMPKSFRKNCSQIFNQIFETKDFSDCAVDNGRLIYRAFNLDGIMFYNEKFTCDGLYYSFSKDLEGIYNFCSFDKHLKSGDFILLECKSFNALDYEKIMFTLYEDYDLNKDRYSKEHEIVSILNSDLIQNIYYIRELDSLSDLNSCLKLNKSDITKTRLKKLLK